MGLSVSRRQRPTAALRRLPLASNRGEGGLEAPPNAVCTPRAHHLRSTAKPPWDARSQAHGNSDDVGRRTRERRSCPASPGHENHPRGVTAAARWTGHQVFLRGVHCACRETMVSVCTADPSQMPERRCTPEEAHCCSVSDLQIGVRRLSLNCLLTCCALCCASCLCVVWCGVGVPRGLGRGSSARCTTNSEGAMWLVARRALYFRSPCGVVSCGVARHGVEHRQTEISQPI